MLAFFSISIGLWGNFRQLWLEDNNFSAMQISNIISVGAFISVIGIVLIGRYITLSKLKRTLTIILIIKFINMLLLYYLNETMQVELIKLAIIIDIVMEYIIITSIYPLITTIVKSDTIYSRRKLTEYLFRDTGILFGGIFIGNIAMSTALGLKMLTLTNYLNFSASIATNYLLIVGLIADVIGIVALKFLTPKNDYITITIKFGIRLLGYAVAFISNNLIITLIAITWSLLISVAYENICDGVYINRVESEYQLTFANIRYIVKFLGEAIGLFFCGIMYEIGFKYMFGLSAIFMIFQIGLAYYLIHLRRMENKPILSKEWYEL